MTSLQSVGLGIFFGLALAVFAQCGCGGQAFTTLDVTAIHIDAGDELTVLVDANTAEASPFADAPVSTGPQSPNDGSGGAPAPSDDAGASMRDAGTTSAADVESPPILEAGPALCDPNRCAPCSAARGYACCTAAGACGCENPSAGGYCL